ncbi:hypothetical protein EVA_08267 [gut metagenome]|uniref:DUF5681 domain-containing protein n=1 Tax=gut metagenome TaxID=749906 RepID=J9GMY5_9ZZZZ
MANEQNLCPPWKPGQSGNPKGRPKDRVPEILSRVFGKAKAKKIYGLSQAEVDKWESIVLTLTAEQLKDLVKYDNCPAYPKNLALAILTDMKNGKTTTIDKLRERQFGKAVQRVELTGKDGQDLMQKSITTTEAKELIEKLERDY